VPAESQASAAVYNNENAVVASVTVVPLQFDQQQKCIAVAALPGNQCTFLGCPNEKETAPVPSESRASKLFNSVRPFNGATLDLTRASLSVSV
jgi:hypothetical protein